MKYRVTHLKSGRVSEMEEEQVRQIQENGFGSLFLFEKLGGKAQFESPQPPADFLEIEETEEIEAEKPTKAKKTPK